MKKIFLTAIALLTMASAQVFGMYGVGHWDGFLVHGNQFRARMDQLGFVLGNGTIKGTFGFRNPYSFGDIFKTFTSTNGGGDWQAHMQDTQYAKFIPDISMGIGYTSSLIGVGVGYSISFGDVVRKFNGKAYGVDGKASVLLGHTPVLVLNALDNNLRISIPIQVVAFNDKFEGGSKTNKTAVSPEVLIRYYTGLDAFSRIDLILRYGNYSEAGSDTKQKAESFGFTFRFDFLKTTIEEVTIAPFIKIAYDTVLGKNHNKNNIKAISILKNPGDNTPTISETKTDKNPYELVITSALGLSANSDIVSLYLEPTLGLKVEGSAYKNTKDSISLAYGVLGDITVTPIKNLEWFFEVYIGNIASYNDNKKLTSNTKGLNFDSSTGITWYLPAL